MKDKAAENDKAARLEQAAKSMINALLHHNLDPDEDLEAIKVILANELNLRIENPGEVISEPENYALSHALDVVALATPRS